VLGAILVFAVVSTLITSVIVYYLPILKKNSEFDHENALLNQFLRIVDGYPNCDLSLQLGGGATVFNPTKTSATLETNISGVVEVGVWNGSTLLFERRILLGCINLTIYNTEIEDLKVVFSEGGVVMEQGNSCIIRKSPDIDEVISFRNGIVRIYNYTSGINEIAGNGVGFLSVHSTEWRSLKLDNATKLTITVRDELFQDYWKNYLLAQGFVQISPNTWSIDVSNLTITIYNVTVELY